MLCLFAGNASVQVNAPPSVLLGKDGGNLPISVKVLNPDGTPASGVGVIIRIFDKDRSGMLGTKNYADTMRMTDSSGSISGTVNLPPLSSSGQHRNGFPINLTVQAFSYRHSSSDDWAAEGSANVTVESAQPIVSSASLSPSAQSGQVSQLSILISDADNPGITAVLNSSGGTLNYSQTSASSGQNYQFGGSAKTITMPWIAPKRGMNAQEVALARSLYAQLEPVTLSSASAQSLSISSKYPTRLGTYVAGLVPDLSASAIITQEQLPENPGISDAYSRAGISLSNVDYNLGFLVLQTDSAHAVSALGDSNSGLANALTGSIGKRLASIPKSHSSQTYFLYVTASDEDLNYIYIYPFRMDYSDFGGLNT